ncbi:MULTISPECIES: helix-turn-helix domain-containing protein, partial [unclassified Acinetobacter]|uniref:helix-turn-helix domain-containing protein n=1 Tax=unclassified Acinetobacter TaxID=196816 RepID=UPI001F4BC0CC
LRHQIKWQRTFTGWLSRILPSESLRFYQHTSSTLGVKKRKMNDSEIRELEKNFSGSKKELANYLGISERTLYRKLGSKE